MTISAFSGPFVSFPETNTSSLVQSNPEGGPSMFNHGIALLDPRAPFTYQPGQNFGKQVSGWLSLNCQTIDQVPQTATINNIVISSGATASVAMTLVAANTTGITVSSQVVNALTGQLVTGLLALDSAMTTFGFGSANTIQIWDPTKAISRNIRISANGNDTSVVFTIRGYDLYGFPLTEAITGANGTSGTASIASGVKAFKYIASVTPSANSGSTGVTVGTGDVIGLPLRADRFSELTAWLGNTAVVASTGFTAGVTTAATSTSGDVRGTYALQTGSNGILRLAIKQAPQVQNTTSSTGLLGVAQYTA